MTIGHATACPYPDSAQKNRLHCTIGARPAGRTARPCFVHDDPALYPWFLHRDLADTLLDDARGSIRRLARRVRPAGFTAYAAELEDWLRQHEVASIHELVLRGPVDRGRLVWAELAFHWSDVAQERAASRNGEAVRSYFHAHLDVEGEHSVLLHGTFNPDRVTCSTANVELRGVRTQYVLGYVASVTDEEIELRPVVIAERLLAPPGRRWVEDDWQVVSPSRVDQFRSADWTRAVGYRQLESLRDIPETRIKQAMAAIIGEPVVPKDWGGEQCDLWTTRLRVDGEDQSAAFVLKGPARFAPMTIAMLGKNGDQLERLARTAAQVLVVQHCHEIRPEVHALVRSLASDFRHVRRYMLIDGFATYRLLEAYGWLKGSPQVGENAP